MPINQNQLRNLIKETLLETDAYSHSAVNLLMGTAAQESKLGTYLKQIRGPALGIMQMEPSTFQDVSNRISRDRQLDLLEAIGMDAMPRPSDMVYNLKLAIMMARYKYLLIPKPLPLPDDIPGMAKYWKKYYNTPLGRGTEEEFMRNYIRYCR